MRMQLFAARLALALLALAGLGALAALAGRLGAQILALGAAEPASSDTMIDASR